MKNRSINFFIRLAAQQKLESIRCNTDMRECILPKVGFLFLTQRPVVASTLSPFTTKISHHVYWIYLTLSIESPRNAYAIHICRITYNFQTWVKYLSILYFASFMWQVRYSVTRYFIHQPTVNKGNSKCYVGNSKFRGISC